MTESKKEKFNIKKSEKQVKDYIAKHQDLIFKTIKKTFEERRKMEEQIQQMIDKTELEIGERKVKRLGNSCYVQVPKKWDKRKVNILLLKEEEKNQDQENKA